MREAPRSEGAARPAAWYWLFLPVWIVVYAAILPTSITLVGEGSLVWEPWSAWEPLLKGVSVGGSESKTIIQHAAAVLVWLFLATGLLAVPILQWAMFMLPSKLPRVAQGPSALLPAVIAVGLLASVLTAIPLAWGVDAAVLAGWTEGAGDAPWPIIAVLIPWAITWPVWALVLGRRASGSPDRMERFVTRAVAGTAIGTGLSIPWYAILRSRESCYCALCSYWSLVVGLWALIMLCGPLLIWVRRRRPIRA